MPIKVWDYLDEYEAERADILAAVDKVFRSGRLILGESVRNFEEAFAAYCGVGFGVGVDNATNGLFLALKALGIEAGDEVITVSNTAVPTVSAIVSAGATPRFVDIDPATYLMDIGRLEAVLTPRVKCILPVHLFGQCVDMDPLLELARGRGLRVLEDCSQAHGAIYKGRKAGSFGDLAVFSFYPTKPLGGYGDGGIVLTSSQELDHKLRRLRFYGMDEVYYAEEHGYNARLDEVHAEILLRKLSRLDQYLAKRRELALRYERALAGTALRLPVVRPGNGHAYYCYVVRHPERDRIMERLKEHEILVNISYPWPIHTMRGYAGLGSQEGDLPHTEQAAREIFSLPMYPSLRFEDQACICRVLTEFMGEPHREGVDPSGA